MEWVVTAGEVVMALDPAVVVKAVAATVAMVAGTSAGLASLIFAKEKQKPLKISL